MHPDTAIPTTNWWQRNWKWCVPVLATLLLGLMLAAVAALFFGILGLIKSSQPYRDAVQAAQHSPALKAALGEPVKPGLLFGGQIHTTQDSGDATLRIPMRGPRGHVTVLLEGRKTGDRWHYTTLEAVSENGQANIDLRPALPSP